MKQQVINGLKVIVIGLILSAGISYAGNWVAPAGPPPGNNAQGPVNVGTVGQTKAGGLGVQNFIAWDNAAFAKDVYVKNIFNPSASGDLYVQKLANNTEEHVCADSEGKLFLCGGMPSIETQCNDGMDNDGDGQIDMADPGCSSPSDDDETNAVAITQCNDGVDNNDPEDTLVDMADPGCSSPSDDDETNTVAPPVAQCDDGIDNDGDAYIDMIDFGCSSLSDNSEKDKYFLTPGSYTWTPTLTDFNGAGSAQVTIKIWGAGGGGGGGTYNGAGSGYGPQTLPYCQVYLSMVGWPCPGAGGGGGGGGYREETITALAGVSYTINVGSGGNGGNGYPDTNGDPFIWSGANGSDGSSSSFGSLVGGTYTSTGGKGGKGGRYWPPIGSGYHTPGNSAQFTQNTGGAGGIPSISSSNKGGDPWMESSSKPRGGAGGFSGSQSSQGQPNVSTGGVTCWSSSNCPGATNPGFASNGIVGFLHHGQGGGGASSNHIWGGTQNLKGQGGGNGFVILTW